LNHDNLNVSLISSTVDYVENLEKGKSSLWHPHPTITLNLFSF